MSLDNDSVIDAVEKKPSKPLMGGEEILEMEQLPDGSWQMKKQNSEKSNKEDAEQRS